MHRRRVLAGLAVMLAPAGCSGPAPTPPVPTWTPPSEYAWFPTGSGLTSVYTLTWIKGLAPEEVVTRAGARRRGWQRWPAGGSGVLAVTRAPGWALMVEDSADAIGAADDTITKLSKGTQLVTYSHNDLAADRFVLAADGTILVDFDPGYPPDRGGTQPDLLVGEMRAAGFNPSLTENATAPPELAALALTERITGVPLTRHLLRDSTYLTASVTVPATQDDTEQERPHY